MQSTKSFFGAPFVQPQRSEPEYNLGNVIRALVDTSFSGGGYELEVSQELARNAPQKPQGILVPWQALGQRDLTVGTGGGSTGGKLVATNLLAQNFIGLLRPVSIVANLGATQLTGLVGNVAIPRATGATSSYWLAESESPVESRPAFDQVPMTPKTLAATTDISRRMVLQSSVDISSFVVSDLRASLGQELDHAVLCGQGQNNEPMGLLNNSNIQTVALGDNGRGLTWDDVVHLETLVASANADETTAAYVTTKAARAKLSTTQKIAVTGADFIWQNATRPQLPGEGVLNGHRAIASTLMPSDLAKGSGENLSAMIYGNWADIVLGTWGAGIDLTLDPYTLSTSGGLRIVAMTDVDVAIRHAESFVKVLDIAT